MQASFSPHHQFIPCSPADAAVRWEQARAGGGLASEPKPDPPPEPERPAPPPVDWAEVERERDALLAAARAESERLVREGQEQAAAARAEARRESQEDLSQALQTLLEQFSEAFQARLQQFEEETPDLLAEMVHKVVGQLLERDDQLVVGVVHEALGQLAGARQVEVVINPADEAAVAAAQADLVSGLGEVNFRLHPSEDVPRGGAIVRTDRGEVDGRLHVQLEILRDRLRLM